MSIMDDAIDNNSNDETWLSNIRNTLRRNQGFVNAFQYIAGTVAVFLPSHFRYSEIFSEGVYSLSRLVSLLNRTLLDGSLESLNGLEPLLRFITKLIATIEVLLEKMSQSLMGPIQRYTTILIIESSKTLCRLMILVERKRPSMLIDWGKDDENSPVEISTKSSSVLDLNHYESWYKVLYNFEIDEHRKNHNHNSRNSRNNRDSTEPVFYTPLARIMARTTRSDSFTDSEIAMRNGNVQIEPFVGKRSGIKLLVDTSEFQRKMDTTLGKNDNNNIKNNNITVSDHMAILSQSSNDKEEDDPNSYLSKDSESLASSYRSGSISNSPMKYDEDGHIHSHMTTSERGYKSNGRHGTRGASNETEIPELVGDKAWGSNNPDMSDTYDNNYKNYNHNKNNKCYMINKLEDVVSDDFSDNESNKVTPINNYDGDSTSYINNSRNKSSIHGREGDINSNMKASKTRNSTDEEVVVDGIGSALGREATSATSIAAEDNIRTRDCSQTITCTEESSTWSPETLLVLGEILHVTRPTIYAMVARHLLGQSWAQDLQFEAREADAAATNHTSSSSNTPNPNAINSEDSHTNNASSDPEDGNPFNFNRFSATAIIRMKVLAIALLASLVVEVSSVLATQRALTLTRERALKQLPKTSSNNNDSNNNRNDSNLPILDLSKIHLEASLIRPHSFDKELRRRKLAILLYLIRTPIFDVSTLPAMRAISRAIANVPLVGGIPDYIVGIVRYLNASHFYNSGSS